MAVQAKADNGWPAASLILLVGGSVLQSADRIKKCAAAENYLKAEGLNARGCPMVLKQRLSMAANRWPAVDKAVQGLPVRWKTEVLVLLMGKPPSVQRTGTPCFCAAGTRVLKQETTAFCIQHEAHTRRG